MADAWATAPIDRSRWRRALRHHLRSELPELRVVCEGFFAEASEIDLLAVGPRGEWITVRIAENGQDGETLTRALSDLAWLRARSPGLLKLAPELGVDPDEPPRALLYAETLSSDTRCAIGMLPNGWLSARRVVPLEHQGRLTLVPDPSGSVRAGHARAGAAASAPGAGLGAPRRAEGLEPAGALSTPGSHRLRASSGPSRFRTGLTDADLEPMPGMTAAEASRS